MKQWIKIERIPGVLASAYEKGTRMVIDSYYSHVAEEIAAHLPGDAILDIGTGPGYLPIEIARRSATVRIIGIDLSRKLLDMARSNAAKAGLSDRLTFQLGDAGRRPHHDLLVEAPEILDRAAAARDDQQVGPRHCAACEMRSRAARRRSCSWTCPHWQQSRTQLVGYVRASNSWTSWSTTPA